MAIADGVLVNRNLQYVFRAQPMGSQFGESSVVLLRDHYAKLGYKSPAEVKVAVIYEDGPYGVSVKEANLLQAKNNQMKVLLTEGYDHKTKDLSSLVLKLKAAKPDVLLHTGYYPDIVLFLRQAREMGLQVKTIIGHGAGYDNFRNLEKQLGPELVQFIYCAAIAPAQNLDRSKLKKEMGPVIEEYLSRYNQKYKEASRKIVIGISKLARLVDVYARRMQIQERIGEQVTEALMEDLEPTGAACIIEAVHMCMRMRGISKQHSLMVTSSIRGAFHEKAARSELMDLIKGSK